jgi:RNA polymerase sigma-70 factor (ECF subfamily)
MPIVGRQDFAAAHPQGVEGMPDKRQEFVALMERVRAGSQDAARELLDNYGDNVLRVVRRRLHQKMRTKFDSQDFVQEVWASFFADSLRDQTFDQPKKLVQYLAAMASHKVLDAMRQRFNGGKYHIEREHSLDGSAAAEVVHLAATTPSPSQVAIANERWQQWRETLPRPVQRVLSLLRRGLTHEEIAQRMGVAAKTIQRLMRNLVPKDLS